MNKILSLEGSLKEWYYKEKKKECTKMNIMVRFLWVKIRIKKACKNCRR